MKPNDLPNSINAELEALIAEQEDDQNNQQATEEIELISAGVNLNHLLDSQQAAVRRLPSGSWKQVDDLTD